MAGPFQASPAPKKKKEPAFDNITVETHQGKVTWRAPLAIDPGVDLKTLRITGSVYAQPCSTACLMPQDFPFVATLGTAPASGPAHEAAPDDPG